MVLILESMTDIDPPVEEVDASPVDLDHEAQETDAQPEPLTPAEMAEVDEGDD